MRRYSVFRAAAKHLGGRASAGVLVLGFLLGGCATDRDATGSIGASLPSSTVDLRAYAAEWGRRHDADPGDATASVNYARALRALTQYSQAAAVLEGAAVKHPYDRVILAAYGKALADCGRVREAGDVLARAHTPERPDWTVLSAQGSVADQLGDHAGAVAYYQAALKIVPGEPTVMSNLGLSYALAKDLPTAETTLRQAAGQSRADARVRQNLALVLALEGKFKEAEDVARQDLSPSEAAASVDAVRVTIAQSDTWSTIRKLGTRGRTLASKDAAAR